MHDDALLDPRNGVTVKRQIDALLSVHRKCLGFAVARFFNPILKIHTVLDQRILMRVK